MYETGNKKSVFFKVNLKFIFDYHEEEE